MKRMSKMEAVGALCVIKKQFENELERRRERLKKKECTAVDANDMEAYEKRHAEECETFISALEMAGRAMTK